MCVSAECLPLVSLCGYKKNLIINEYNEEKKRVIYCQVNKNAGLIKLYKCSQCTSQEKVMHGLLITSAVTQGRTEAHTEREISMQWIWGLGGGHDLSAGPSKPQLFQIQTPKKCSGTKFNNTWPLYDLEGIYSLSLWVDTLQDPSLQVKKCKFKGKRL